MVSVDIGRTALTLKVELESHYTLQTELRHQSLHSSAQHRPAREARLDSNDVETSPMSHDIQDKNPDP